MNSVDVSKIVREAIQKELKEYFPSASTSNSMTTTPLSSTILWRPNNYRLGVSFRGVPGLGVRAGHTGLIFFRNGNITVQVGKSKIVGIWNQGKDRQTWIIGRDSVKELDRRLDEVKLSIMDKIKAVVLDYAVQSNLSLFDDWHWVRHEDWIKGEEYINRIPREFTIHDTVFKKVYNDPGIEFIGGKDKQGIAEIKSYIKNRVVEDFAPAIAEELKGFNQNILDLKEVTLLEIENKKLHMAVLNDMRNTLRSINSAHQSLVISPLLSGEGVDGFSTTPKSVAAHSHTISKYDSRGVKALKLVGWL